MAVIIDAQNKNGKYSQICLHAPDENSTANIIIIENYKDIIETNDYNVLKRYTKFNDPADKLDIVRDHISYLYDYIEFISNKLQISQHANLPEFKKYHQLALGSRLKEQVYKQDLDDVKRIISQQNRHLESNNHYKDHAIKFSKWMFGIISAIMVAICVCFAMNFSALSQSHSRYIKSGKLVIDTKTNSILTRYGDEWVWESIQKKEN